MAKAERFEDLIVWQEARALRKEVYAASKKGDFAKDFEMRAQIRAAALSGMDNSRRKKPTNGNGRPWETPLPATRTTPRVAIT